MEVQIVAKNISYGFEQNDTFKTVQQIAEKTAAEFYKDEQDFQKEEYEAMLADGDVSNFEEYKEEVGITDNDIDYSKSFEENKSHPQVERQIADLTNKYMCNVMDLPQNAVVSIDDSFLDEKGKPDESAVRSALKEKFGSEVNIAKYDTAAEAEKKDILSQEAYDKVGEMIKSKDFQQFLDLRASIGKYSSNNISLIYLQKPDSKAVMGFNAWKKLDRHVDKGQKGISIWQPCKKELKTEKQVDKYIAENEWQFGKPDSTRAVKEKTDLMKEIADKGKADVNYGFRLGTVFDVGQTVPNDPSKDNIDRIINLDKPLNQDMANYDDIVKSMKEAATLAPFSIKDSTSQQDALFEAVCQYADKLLKESPEKVAGIKSHEPLKGDTHKVETVMAAHLICKHIGIECDEKSSLKLAEIFNKDNLSEEAVKVGKREMFIKSFDRACKVSDQFNKEFDKSFGYDLEAQRNAVIEEAAQKEAELAKNRTYFGRNPMQKVDEWKTNDRTFVVAQSEVNNGFYVKSFDEEKKGVMLKGDDGKAAKFDTAPSRAEVESMYERNNPSQDKSHGKADVSKGKSEKNTKKQENIEKDD